MSKVVYTVTATEKNAPYFDIVHFAPRIRVPVRSAVGLSDTTCPPAPIEEIVDKKNGLKKSS